MSGDAATLLEQARDHRTRAARARELSRLVPHPEVSPTLAAYAVELDGKASELEAQAAGTGKPTTSGEDKAAALHAAIDATGPKAEMIPEPLNLPGSAATAPADPAEAVASKTDGSEENAS